ncbi:signal peptidase I [Pelagirhabdus alkalitolerans]|uniref:Signal peptidase I n=1 Tax=Pelagirhabdus alkalitolerans TaxID=1612202 RepID=A0A1G6H2K8_9BACI|nr:signal peptidase I [Pelagirhabdus alkalitolerans]SDB88441.1 signal peptidase I [Pelagirhabdus alkalitolerans]
MSDRKKEWFSWLKAILIAFVLVWILRAFVFMPIAVEGPSMLPTLRSDDHVIIEKVSYRFSDPARFDVIVFNATEEKDYVKRIVGLPGETVEIRDDQLFIDGESIDEPFIDEIRNNQAYGLTYTDDYIFEGVIPEGHYFVLGDNRQNSTDSRAIGLVEEDDIIGQAVLTYWPLRRIQIVS